MFCYKCGQSVTEGKAFCRHCGTAIPAVPRARVRNSAAGAASRKARIAAGVAVICVALLVGSVFLVYGILGAPPPKTVAGGLSAPAGTSSTLARSATGTSVPVGSTTTITLTRTTTSTIPTTSTTVVPTTTSTQRRPDLTGRYAAAAATVLQALTTYAERIPQLGDQIGASAPDVPHAVFDELRGMLEKLQAAYDDLRQTALPSGFEDSDRLLDEAAVYTRNRVRYALEGIQAMWDTGWTLAASPSFAKARQARDRASAALDAYRQLVAMR